MSDELMELPEGWEWTTAIEVCSKVVDCHNKTAPYTTSGIKLVRTSNIRNGQINLDNTKFVDQPTYEFWSRRCPPEPGDLLFTREAPMAEVGMIPSDERLCMGQRMMLLRADNENLLGKYLLYALQAPPIHSYADRVAVGTGVKHLRVKDVEQIPIPLPPLNEQKRIVAKIDELRERSQKVREALTAIPELCDKFRQSVLAAAFRGDLTADWREQNLDVESASVLLERIRRDRRNHWEIIELEKMRAKGRKPKDDKWKETYKDQEKLDNSKLKQLSELPEMWSWSTWESILSFDPGAFKRGPFGSALKKEIFVSSGYKVYEQYCPINDDCSYSRYYITPEKFEELKAFAVQSGDFLISCSGVSLGRITQVPSEFEEGVINQALLRVRLNDTIINDRYFIWFFRSPFFQKQIFENATGSAIPNVKGVDELKALPIPIPPLEEQIIIIDRVLEQFKAIDEIEQMLQKSKTNLTLLDRSILAKAFRGELVEQNPNDEPASVLLERIRAEREQQAQGKTKKQGRKRK